MHTQHAALLDLAGRVARLNPDAGRIGPGMLADLVARARRALSEPPPRATDDPAHRHAPIRVGRGVQLNFTGNIRPDYALPPAYAGAHNLPSDEQIGTLDAPDAMPAGAVYRAASNNMVMQRFCHRAQDW